MGGVDGSLTGHFAVPGTVDVLELDRHEVDVLETRDGATTSRAAVEEVETVSASRHVLAFVLEVSVV